MVFFFFSSRRRHTRWTGDWSSDVCSSDLGISTSAAALVLMPWNPALWWQVRRLRLAVEIDCDGRVLARGGTPPEYFELLLQVGRRRARFALAVPALGEPASFL